MHITFSPQRSDVPLSYEINGDVIDVALGEQTETLDFSGTEDGVWERDEETGLIDDLGVVVAARRENGELHVTLRNHHGPSGDYNVDERFPDPVEVTEPAAFSFPKPMPAEPEEPENAES